MINHVDSITHQGKYQCVAFLPEYGAIISLPAKLEMECKFFHLKKIFKCYICIATVEADCDGFE